MDAAREAIEIQASITEKQDRLADLHRLAEGLKVWGDVTLEAHPAVYIKDLFIKPSVRNGELVVDYTIANGGLDANWMSSRGIPTVSLGCGQENGHTTAERLDGIECRVEHLNLDPVG